MLQVRFVEEVQLSFEEIKDKAWSGAIQRLETVENHDLEEEFMAHISELFDGCDITPTELNDYIWHDLDAWLEEQGAF